VAVFTNLTQDHLDYHKTMENYAAAKAKLFRSLGKDKMAIVNVDNSWASFLLQECQAERITYGIDTKADLMATDIALSPEGIKFGVTYKDKQVPFRTTLIGRFNLYNCLAALGVGLTYGFSLEEMAPLVAGFKSVRGRL